MSRGRFWVDIPYEQTTQVINGMLHTRLDLQEWLRVNLETTSRPLAVIRFNDRAPTDSSQTARYFFHKRSEALLFKLTWGGSV